MYIEEKVLFQASPEEVWDLLTNPEKTRQYMFGCELQSDWQVGSPVHWKGKLEDGSEKIFVQGEVIEYEAPQKVTTTTFDPDSGLADVPEHHLQLTYELQKTEGGTLLTIRQGDYSVFEGGAERFEESKTGWLAVVIPAMKELLT
ncbi:MAG: SRPBCC domain-containing protein [Bacteroidota bacterium]